MLLFDRNRTVCICLENQNKYVRKAAEDLRRDFARVNKAGALPPLVDTVCDGCVVIEENTVSSAEPLADEGFTIDCHGNTVRISAAGYLGTMWGIYTFSEKILGIDPCYLFHDIPPETHDALSMPEGILTDAPVTFGFRGIFINDEDLLTDWKQSGGARHIDFPWYHTTVDTSVMRMVVETALRLKLNLVIPASFLDIANPPEKALADCVAERGIYVSQHHIEPLGVSSFTFQNYCRREGIDAQFSYVQYPLEMEHVWRVYAGQWAQYDNVVWQIGLRGQGDRPMWQDAVPSDDQLKTYGQFISNAYQRERDIVTEVTGGRAKHFTSTLWMEGSALMEKGYLTVPKNTVTVFADTGVNQMFGKEYFKDRVAGNKYGVYYHLAFYQCGPHLCPETGLKKLHYNIGLAVQNGDTAYFIMNVSNLREFCFEMGAYARMVWNYDTYSNDEYLKTYCGRLGEYADALAEEIREYFTILPEIDRWQLHWYCGKYFNYAIHEAPRDIKNFVLKEGTVLDHGNHLYERFCRETDPGYVCESIYKELRRVLPQYADLRARFAKTAIQLPQGWRRHVEVRWLLYTETLFDIYSWYIYLYEARVHNLRAENGEAKAALSSAAAALEEYLAVRKRAEYGEFENWYRGDSKMDIPRHLRQTKSLLENIR